MTRRFSAVSVAIGAVFASPAAAGDPPKHETVSAVLGLTPAHRSASITRRFLYANVGIESLRLTLPRGLHAELLILNSVESITGQRPSKMLCVPFRLCHDPGRTALRFCRDSGRETICAYTTEGGPIFPAGRWVLTVRELESRWARATLRVVFVRGPGG